MVREASGPSVTVDGKKYQLLGYDAKGSPVYEDARIVREAQQSTAAGESILRNQAFQTDVSKYTGAARKTVENAVNSGILNNTSGTHEFVELVAKLSQDKGIVFDFADNAKLRQTGFALEGVTVNGFFHDSGVTVNVDSAKALNSVVGHEIAHVLEETELYETLKSAIEAYAKGRGDYDARLEQLTKLYEGKPGYTGANAAAKIQREVVADLVGDYLFVDKAFVEKLSAEHRNVFQKIFDEIQYLCKLATAGSKEARQLERVKKIFEDAYRTDKESISKTKYNLANNNQRKYNKRSRYSETETLFLRWENGSAPIGEVKKFVRHGKIHYYEKTENGCVELSKSQYSERNGNDGENFDRRAERRFSNANDYDESTQGGKVGNPDGHRNTRGNAAVFGQAIREKLRHDTAGSISGAVGYDHRNNVKQSVLSEEASDDSGASLITFSNDYNTIRNFMQEDLSAGKTKYSISKTETNRQYPVAWNIPGEGVGRGNSAEAQIDKKVVTAATGPSVTVDGKKYQLLGYDAKGSPVYEDARIVQEAAKAAEQHEASGVVQEESSTVQTQKSVANSKNDGILTLSTRYLNKNDSLYGYSKKIQPLDGFEDVVTHGDPISLVFKDADGRESNVSAEEFVSILKNDPNYKGGNIRLIACQAAANGGAIPKYIAKRLNVTVIAPTEKVNVDWNGHMVLTDDEESLRLGLQTGEWLVFEPGKEGVSLDLYRKIRGIGAW